MSMGRDAPVSVSTYAPVGSRDRSPRHHRTPPTVHAPASLSPFSYQSLSSTFRFLLNSVSIPLIYLAYLDSGKHLSHNGYLPVCLFVRLFVFNPPSSHILVFPVYLTLVSFI
ncbi:ORF17 [Rat cytomegalovirus ALL-03]|uniref:ORF17 n=2 Tax=Rat cytomegalovirus (isolate England) TaxID=1261657 RepID=A0A0F6R468_RCMVE|nr:eORF16 [Murid betaherpesvirus 8]AFX83473.1 eORF16 [Murid betaherpesvirus 8]AKE44193.1 ORF17 [Rat cytomegalovirus ALL-03]